MSYVLHTCDAFCLFLTPQVVFGLRRFRCDQNFLLVAAESRFSVQRLSVDQQARLSALAASEGDLLPSRSGVCWLMEAV